MSTPKKLKVFVAEPDAFLGIDPAAIECHDTITATVKAAERNWEIAASLEEADLVVFNGWTMVEETIDLGKKVIIVDTIRGHNRSAATKGMYVIGWHGREKTSPLLLQTIGLAATAAQYKTPR